LLWPIDGGQYTVTVIVNSEGGLTPVRSADFEVE
jgi:hypothetical protein